MTRQEINKVLDLHLKWLRCGEEDGKRANLSHANLAGANLAGANLAGANLTGAILTDANLTGANLTGANLTGAELSYAILTDAILSYAKLAGADLTGADLTDAILSYAKLAGAKNAPLVAAVSWTDHGECGRTLVAMQHSSTGVEPVYRCGCFVGSVDALKQYIADGPEGLRESRTEALEIVSGLMDRMIARRKQKEAA